MRFRMPHGMDRLLTGVLCALLCFCICTAGLAEAAEKGAEASKVVVTPQPDPKPGQATVNGVETQDLAVDPATAAMEDRIMRYKFILESLGFVLEEVVFSPEWEHTAELIFKGRLNASQEKLQELTQKFPEEQKLMGILRTVYAYNNRDLTNYGAYMVVLRLSEPVGIRVHYKKF